MVHKSRFVHGITTPQTSLKGKHVFLKGARGLSSTNSEPLHFVYLAKLRLLWPSLEMMSALKRAPAGRRPADASTAPNTHLG
ncbi:hypothetical protein WJX72_006022 [[Myrmecia] bisecta]|uniref:Uncharacterized protein n=1 Tax=[Myrmecia] bisecta TaxID=41462 RepID=A0AAW1QRW8_9CHLO